MRRVWALLGVAYYGLIWWLSSAPRPVPIHVPFEHLDKVVHALAFGALCFLLLKASAGRVRLAVVLTAALGILDEIHQGYVPGRDQSVGDAVADLVGALLVAAAWRRFSATCSAAHPQ